MDQEQTLVGHQRVDDSKTFHNLHYFSYPKKDPIPTKSFSFFDPSFSWVALGRRGLVYQNRSEIIMSRIFLDMIDH